MRCAATRFDMLKSSRREPFRRIVCLTEEPTEILYALGEAERVVGISAYTVRPEAARDKPVVSAFVGGSTSKILALEPDLVIGFSDIQADLARELIAMGLPVLIFNQRSVQEILDVILGLGRLVGAHERAERLVDSYVARLSQVAQRSCRARRPRVYFEEWDEPAICGIRWVSELIEIAGGEDVFAARSRHSGLAKDRIVTVEEIVAAQPEVVLASWCGKPFDRAAFARRFGPASLPALQRGQVFELDASIILQPGPAALTDGLDALVALLARC
jgi:iron complex transport system substrate-binding protein